MKSFHSFIFLLLALSVTSCTETAISTNGSPLSEATTSFLESVPSSSEDSEMKSIEIHTVSDWNKIAENLNGHFVLSADLDFQGNEIISIGDSRCPFTGIFDGANHTLSNFRLPEDSPSLFHYSKGVIQNLKVILNQKYQFRESVQMGGIVGTLDGGFISNCSSSGTLSVDNSAELDSTAIGGIVGKNEAGCIEGCTSSISLTVRTSGTNFVGAIAGYNGGGASQQATVKSCIGRTAVLTAECSYIRASSYLGGIAGYNFGSIEKCLSYNQTLTSKTTDYYAFAGGIAGDNNGGYITDCFSSSDIATVSDSASTFRGAVTGRNFRSTQEENSGESYNSYGSVLQSVTYSIPAKNEQTTAHEKVTVPLAGLSQIQDASWYRDTLHLGEEFLIKDAYFPSLDSSFSKIDSNTDPGSPANPIPLSTADDLLAITPETSYILTCDISLRDVNFTAIGTLHRPFSGVFDGNGHTIKDIKFSSAKQMNSLFGYINGTIQNLNTEYSAVCASENTNLQYFAGIASFAIKSVIQDCHSKVSINASSHGMIAGGLIGYATECSVIRCSSEGTLSGSSSTPSGYLGGLIGVTYHSSIWKCYAKNDISSGGEYATIGGLIGKNEGNITDSYAISDIRIASVKQSVSAGGLVGYAKSGVIRNIFTVSHILSESDCSDQQLGGIAGINESTLTNCYYHCNSEILYSCGHSPVEVHVARLSESELSDAADALGDAFYNGADGVPHLDYEGERA